MKYYASTSECWWDSCHTLSRLVWNLRVVFSSASNFSLLSPQIPLIDYILKMLTNSQVQSHLQLFLKRKDVKNFLNIWIDITMRSTIVLFFRESTRSVEKPKPFFYKWFKWVNNILLFKFIIPIMASPSFWEFR